MIVFQVFGCKEMQRRDGLQLQRLDIECANANGHDVILDACESSLIVLMRQNVESDLMRFPKQTAEKFRCLLWESIQ